MPLMFGYMGLFSMVGFCPVLIGMELAGAGDLAALTPYVFGLVRDR
jgi:hypothetical protein